MRAFLADALPDATARGIAAGMALYLAVAAVLGAVCILRLNGAL